MKKVLSVILAFFMAFSAFSVVASAVEADGSDMLNAIVLKSKKMVEFRLDTYGTRESMHFKVNVKDAGTLKIVLTGDTTHWSNWAGYGYRLYVYDETGEILKVKDCTANTGEIEKNTGKGKSYVKFYGDSPSITSKYSVRKGIYYVKVVNDSFSESKCSISVTYPFKVSATPEESDDAKLLGFTIPMKKGETLKLGTFFDGETDDVTWKSSKSSVVIVSSTGKIAAKKKGTAIISATCGKTTIKIKIKVT